MINAEKQMKSLALAGIAFILCTGATVPVVAQNAGDQIVLMQTSRGPIRMRIFYSVLPYTAGNFLDLVDSGFYNGLTFHRVENWVVQGGDPNGNGSGHATDPNTGQVKFLRFECNPKLNHNQAGMVAMARSANINSASCQFYILKSPMPQLNGKYSVFGRVVGGMDAVYAMRPGDRIISAAVLSGNNNSSVGSSSESSSPEPVPTGSDGKPRDSGF
jgi:peptidyl-prolyl cis-trans isomerase B (cyclophilin B)